MPNNEHEWTFFRISVVKERLSSTGAKKAHTAGAYPGLCNMKQLRVLLLPPGWDASPSQGYPQQYVPGTHLYTWVERDNVGYSFLSKERTDDRDWASNHRPSESEVQRANYYTTAPPISGVHAQLLKL